MKPEVAAALVNVETSLPSRERGLKHADITCIRLARMSLPSRERGLKHQPPPNPLRQCHVAPFTGAWIETRVRLLLKALTCVAPFTGAWIETTSHTAKLYRCTVAPFTGAWIETQRAAARVLSHKVAPFTGAWIETALACRSCSLSTGRSLHGSVD